VITLVTAPTAGEGFWSNSLKCNVKILECTAFIIFLIFAIQELHEILFYAAGSYM
jgi:hypothetical protein